MCVYYMQVSNAPPEINTLPECPITVKDIFLDNGNWERYRFYHRHELREVEIAEVEKMLLCKEEENGYFTCFCPSCDEYHIQFLGCNSRICSRCGKRYTDNWAKGLSKRLFDVPHRHFVMSVASQLWPILLKNRSFWKVVMDAAIRTINNVLSRYTHQDLIAGAIVVLHPFGKDLKFQPHIHVLLTEGGFDKKGQFVHEYFFPAKAMRKVWQYEVLTALKSELEDTYENRMLIDYLFKRYNNGFYVWLPKESRIKSNREVGKYVGRYVRHPAIANYRLASYDGKKVKFWYDDRDGKRHWITMEVDEFIGALLRHIPDKQFKMIRYYGAYCRKWIGKYRKLRGLSSITQRCVDDSRGGRKFRCPKCGAIMEIIHYREKGPPRSKQFGEIIGDWVTLCTS
jgi:Putative transposase/Transposase zinc-binding domain